MLLHPDMFSNTGAEEFRYQALPTEAPSQQDYHLQMPSVSVRSQDVGDGGTRRGLQERHLSMMALAGMIGTGLFLSSGKALAQAGPLGCVLGFILMGTVTASIAYSSAEMSAFKPVGGGFVRHANIWMDKSTGIAIGWNFWYSMAITMPTEISAATALVNFWTPSLSHAVPISCLWLLIAIINFSPVRVYGEFEFYFAFCKIALIITFIITGIVLDAGGLPGQERIGFRYWQDPYPLFREYIKTGPYGRFLGFWSTLISATFAYGNVQVVAIAGAETRNPRKSIPSALKKTFTRVILFYVVSVFVISLTVPANDERLNAPGDISRSPFVIAFTRVGIKALPSIINAIVFTSAFSSGNACTFLASRTLHGLALDGHAPSVFLKLNRYQVPYVAVTASVVWGGIAYASLNRSAYQAFSWLVSLVTTSGIISWVIIGITYIRFFRALKVQGIQREFLPYKSPFQPYITYYALVMNLLVLIFSGWNAFSPRFDGSLFASNYLNCFIYPVLYFALKMWLKDEIIPLHDIDFESEFTAIKAEEERDDYSHDDFRGTYYNRILNALF